MRGCVSVAAVLVVLAGVLVPCSGEIAGVVAQVQGVDVLVSITASDDPSVQTGSSYTVRLVGVDTLMGCSDQWLRADELAEFMLLGREVHLALLPASGLAAGHLRAVLSLGQSPGTVPDYCGSFGYCLPCDALLRFGLAVVASDDFFAVGNSQAPFSFWEDYARDERRGLWRDYGQTLLAIDHVSAPSSYIVIRNDGYERVSLDGWALTDGEGCYSFPAETELLPGSNLLIEEATYNPRGATRWLNLNVERDRVFLLTPEGYIADYFEWGMPWQK